MYSKDWMEYFVGNLEEINEESTINVDIKPFTVEEIEEFKRNI